MTFITSHNWESTPISGIYSKNLLELGQGTVKLIRLDPGAQYPIHQHPERSEYAFVLEGNPTIAVAEERHMAKVGDFHLFPAHTLHALGNSTTQSAVLLVGAFQPADAADAMKQKARQDNLKGIIRELLQEELEAFYQRLEQRFPNGESE